MGSTAVSREGQILQGRLIERPLKQEYSDNKSKRNTSCSHVQAMTCDTRSNPYWVDKGCIINMFAVNFSMTNVREMVNLHLPVVLKVINSAALVVIALSSLCAADSLKEMAGEGAASAVIVETD